jgi:hypothetical protein
MLSQVRGGNAPKKGMEPITKIYIATRERLVRAHRAHVGLEKAFILSVIAILAYGTFRIWKKTAN